LKYEGSLTIAVEPDGKGRLQPYEKILCGNMANGETVRDLRHSRQTRVSGQIIMNGAVAHLGKKGDLLTIMNFCGSSARRRPKKMAAGASLCSGKGNQIVGRTGNIIQKGRAGAAAPPQF